MLSLLSLPSPALAGDDDEGWTSRLSQGFVDLWLTRAQQGHLWLHRLDTSPAAFLRRKFALQAQPSAPEHTGSASR